MDIQVGEDVRIPTPEGSLAGSLLKPASGAAPAPAVLMITGSGSYSYRKALQPGVPTHWKAAAALYPEEVAFVICLAGPNISVRQQIIDDLVNEWHCNGIGEGSILKKEKRLRTKFGLYAGLSRVVKIGYLSRIIDYDPVNIGARIRCPILALYGEHDTLVLPETNIPLLRAGLEQGGNVNFRIVTIPGAGHGFHRIPGKCPDWDKIEETIAPELRAELAAWDPFTHSPSGN